MNLVTNALKFSPEDEPVAIEVLEANGGLRVAVTDRGAGIAPEDFPKLFQKFSRLTEPAGHKRTRGTGLGLYSCRLMVEAQGGRIWAVSSPGDGSTFSYTLPVARKGAP